MGTIPKIVRDRLEAMSLADLNIMAETCGNAATTHKNDKMRIRVEWLSHIMAMRIAETFKTTTNDNEVIVSK
jgi:hypothetical protein